MYAFGIDTRTYAIQHGGDQEITPIPAPIGLTLTTQPGWFKYGRKYRRITYGIRDGRIRVWDIMIDEITLAALHSFRYTSFRYIRVAKLGSRVLGRGIGPTVLIPVLCNTSTPRRHTCVIFVTNIAGRGVEVLQRTGMRTVGPIPPAEHTRSELSDANVAERSVAE